MPADFQINALPIRREPIKCLVSDRDGQLSLPGAYDPARPILPPSNDPAQATKEHLRSSAVDSVMQRKLDATVVELLRREYYCNGFRGILDVLATLNSALSKTDEPMRLESHQDSIIEERARMHAQRAGKQAPAFIVRLDLVDTQESSVVDRLGVAFLPRI